MVAAIGNSTQRLLAQNPLASRIAAAIGRAILGILADADLTVYFGLPRYLTGDNLDRIINTFQFLKNRFTLPEAFLSLNLNQPGKMSRQDLRRTFLLFHTVIM